LVRLWIAITDGDWHEFLSGRPDIDEVNFWQPGGQKKFSSLLPGEPFLFKLHSPRNYIVGCGFFAHATILPMSLAWETFGEKNGARTSQEMRARIEKYRRVDADPLADYQIGCILLEQPVFFREQDWIPSPVDFSLNIVQGKSYDLTREEGKRIWERVQPLVSVGAGRAVAESGGVPDVDGPRYGDPAVVLPRLGQGTFRLVIADAYERRCAVTRERTFPALEAAHIKPYSKSGPHRVANGLLLRRDIHSLFDLGYVTVTRSYHFEVSRKIREDFENGRDYYALQGKEIWVPPKPELRPGREYLDFHAENVFRG